MVTVGTGKYTYELVEGWAKLPEGWTLGQTGIVTDSHDRVYLFNRSAHPLMVFDREDNFLTAWGEGVLTSAHGMFIDPQENIYLAVWVDSHGDIYINQNQEGRRLLKYRRCGEAAGHNANSGEVSR